MTINLNFEHIDGLRLRQQIAESIRLENDDHEMTGSAVVGAKEWHFEKLEPGAHVSPDREVPRDLNPKTKEPLNTYTGVSLSFGLKNLVIDARKGTLQVPFRNSSVRNQLRVKYQSLHRRKSKDGLSETEIWKDSGTPQYIAPQTWGGVTVGDGQRAILDEMPT